MPSFLASLFGGLPWFLPAILGIALAVALAAVFVVEGAMKKKEDLPRAMRWLGVEDDLRSHYVVWLTRGLNAVDRFLGDAGKEGDSLPSPFGNRVTAPYWTGWSFDRMAVIAVVYPFIGVFMTWVAEGDAGEIGRMLLMLPEPAVWKRVVVGSIPFFVVLAETKSLTTDGWRSLTWFVVNIIIVVVAVTVNSSASGALIGAVAIGFSLAGSLGISISGGGVSAVAFALAGATAFAFMFDGAIAHSGVNAVVFTLGFAMAGVSAAAITSRRAALGQWLGRLWLCLWPIVVAIVYAFCWLAAGPFRPVERLTLLVMLGLVPLVNMPFDWASVGVTRALLRRGCEPGAPSPFWLGLLDFAIGLVLILPLGLTLIVATHLVVWVVVHGGGYAFLNVRGLLYAIEDDPWQAANWWIYLTLFSTLIPSVLNCIVGAFSLITWMFPPLRHWLHRTLPDVGDKGMDHNMIIIAVGVQVFLSVALPLVALVILYNAALWLAPGVLPAFLAGAKTFAFWLLLVLPV